MCVTKALPKPEVSKLSMSILVWTLLMKVLLSIHTSETAFLKQIGCLQTPFIEKCTVDVNNHEKTFSSPVKEKKRKDSSS